MSHAIICHVRRGIEPEIQKGETLLSIKQRNWQKLRLNILYNHLVIGLG